MLSALHIFVSCILVVDTPTLALVGESQQCIELCITLTQLRVTPLQGGSRNINWGLSHKVESPCIPPAKYTRDKI